MFFDNVRGRATIARLAALLLVFVTAPALYSQKQEMPLTASKEALAIFVQARDKVENLEDPGTLFDQAIAKDPNFAVAYLFAGDGPREFSANLDKAVALADKVSPGEKELIFASKAQSDGDLPQRKMHLDNLLRLHPADKRAHVQMGFYFRSIGDESAALRHFNEAVTLDKNFAAAWNHVGYSHLNLGRYAESEKAFKTYIRLIPKNPNPYDSYAEMLMKTGKYDESIKQYEKALSVDPTFVASYRGIGTNYVYKGDYIKAREAYQKMYDQAPGDGLRDQALTATMNSYVAEGNIDKALEVSERRRLLNEKAGNINGLINVHASSGFFLLESGRLEDAARQFAKADELRKDPSLPAASAPNRRFGSMQANTRMAIARGDFAAAKSQLDEIKQHLERVKNPNQERTYYATLGMLELKQKNYPGAIAAFAKADQTDPYVLFYQAAAYEGSGDAKKAAVLYGKVIDWNDLDTTGHSIVRPRAITQQTQAAKGPK